LNTDYFRFEIQFKIKLVYFICVELIAVVTMPESLPNWVAEEVSGSKFEADENFKGTGYFLDLNEKENIGDIQFYERLPEGRFIVSVDIPKSIKITDLKKGELYLFEIKIFKSVLSDKVKQFLEEQYQVKVETIYKYELVSSEELKEPSEGPEKESVKAEEESDDDED